MSQTRVLLLEMHMLYHSATPTWGSSILKNNNHGHKCTTRHATCLNTQIGYCGQAFSWPTIFISTVSISNGHLHVILQVLEMGLVMILTLISGVQCHNRKKSEKRGRRISENLHTWSKKLIWGNQHSVGGVTFIIKQS